MATQWFAQALVAHGSRRVGAPVCKWPPSPISRRRELDLTQCFEQVLLLPVPLVLAVLVATLQITSIQRRLKRTGPDGVDWIQRSAKSERIARAKTGLLAFASILAVAAAGLAAPQLAKSPYAFIQYVLLTVTMFLFAYLVWLNHHTSRTSSTLVLLFFPLYLLIGAVTVRTAIATGQFDPKLKHSLNGRLLIAREAMWFASLGVGLIVFVLELYSPEKQWSRFRFSLPWSNGKIRLEDEEEEAGDTFEGDNDLKDDYDKESPVATANIFERLTFSWLTPLLQLGTQKYLGEEDMWRLPPDDSADALADKLDAAWQHQLDLVRQGKKKEPSLKAALAKAYGWPYLIAGILKSCYDILNFSQPQLLRLLLLWVSSYSTDHPMGAEAGVAIAVLMFLLANTATALLHQYFDRCFLTTMRVRTGLVTLIYRKSLKLNQGERAGRTSGDIVNLQSVDSVRIGDIAQYGHIAWSGPFQIILAFVSLYNLIGWQAFMGVGVMVISLPINTLISRLQKRLQRQLMRTKDVRTRLMSEILNNIKSIKLYGWETAFADKVYNARNNMELKMLKRIGIVMSCSNFIWTTVPIFVAFATFSTYVATSPDPLTSVMIFPAISLFQLLAFPMSVFSNIINSIIEALVSVDRLEKFLAADELDPKARECILPSEDPQGEPKAGDVVVSIENGEFRWVRDSVEPTLEDINITVTKGELLAVIGRVGDGKSSLLAAILGEMNRSEGKVKVRGEIAYFSQNSWILSATVKENIVFGHRFDPVFYDKVLDACALRADLAVLPDGHMTEVGEKGVSLSGGQKARICLARACYARADIYLLDDPLSAVDAHVGRHIFDNVIGPHGLLKSKARILCTNAVNVLPQTDQIIMLRKGIIVERGTYAAAMADTSTELYKLITGLGKQSAREGDSSGSQTPTLTIVASESDDESMSVDDSEEAQKRQKSRRESTATRRASILSLRQAKVNALRDLRESAKPKEHIEKGSVKRDVYRSYLRAASYWGAATFVFCMAAGQASGILSNNVLRKWGDINLAAGRNVDVPYYLGMYGVLGVSSGLLNVLAIFVLKVYSGLRAARTMHDLAFSALMRAPLSFFEITPTGRILNLFSRDIFVTDEILSMVLGQFTRTCVAVLGVVAVIAGLQPMVLLVFIPLGYIYRAVMRYYLATSRELKRLDAVSRSPIFSFFGETLAGLAVIRAYNQVGRFIANNEARVDRNQSCYQPAMAINRWLAVRLEFLGSCLIFTAAMASVVALLYTGIVTPGAVGLLMSYTISVTGSLNWLVRSASEVEQNIVSVERVLGYAALEAEAAEEIPETKPPAGWPANGSIEFDEYCMRYRPELPEVLKKVCVKIKGGDRVGVVGRTGAGKSSLTLALFRILEAAGGRIWIDGVDIATIGLRDLRNVISIIPQDPQLFEGSLRSNVDPTDKASDAEIWTALEQAHLKEHVMKNMGGTLDAEISEGGSNLSSGQRQLVCFARALLRRTKILVLDEATSSIDLETDEAVQAILRGPDFKGVTTLTIAHRINTILDSDMVLVMENGQVAEYDSPETLLTRPDSVFTSLVNESGLGASSSRAPSRAPSRPATPGPGTMTPTEGKK